LSQDAFNGFTKEFFRVQEDDDRRDQPFCGGMIVLFLGDDLLL
jgi:hypothetical protein